MPEITQKAALLLCQDLKGRLNIVINSVYIFDCLTHLMHEGESAGLAGYPNGTLEDAYLQARGEIEINSQELCSAAETIAAFFLNQHQNTNN